MNFDSTIAQIPTEYRDFYARMVERTSLGSANRAIAPWLEKNTKLAGRPWSFKDHEFQVEIANDEAADACIMKCSQVGLSELAVRIALAMLAMKTGRSLIYVLPSEKFAIKFTKSRIDPVIEGSDRLTELLVTSANSATMKRLGGSIFYIGGAANQKQAISIPAEVLIIDEYDFCNMMVLTTYNSRLRHAKEDEKIKRRFSTPTVSKYGISREYEVSTRKRYMVKCTKCNHEQAPDFNSQVVIPGFDLEFKQFSKDDLFDLRYDPANAYIRCARCGNSLDHALATAERRRWVSEFPTRSIVGYAVKPHDVIATNPTHSVIMQLNEYAREQDYWNFVQGEPIENDENSFRADVIRNNTIVHEMLSGNGMYMGIDVGKYIHILIGKRQDNKLAVVRALRIKHGDESAREQIVELWEDYGCYGGVIDMQPDYHLGKELRQKLGEWFHQAHYVKGRAQDKGYMELATDTGVVNIARTRAFDTLAKRVNKGGVLFPMCADQEDIAIHSEGMKRVEEMDEEGTNKAKWVKVGEGLDHYLHALMYLNVAIELDDPEEEDGPSRVQVAGLPSIHSVARGAVEESRISDSAVLASMFGVSSRALRR